MIRGFLLKAPESKIAIFTAGQNLRSLRERLGLTMREVETASVRIAERHRNDEFAVSPSRLSDIETKGLVPSVFRLYSLAVIYRCDAREVLSWYGIDLSLSATDLDLNLPPRSHVAETLQGAMKVEVPTRLDPAFDPRCSANLSRMVVQWGLIPLAYLAKFSGDKYIYGYIGSEDFTMYPSDLFRGDPRRLYLLVVHDEGRPDHSAAPSAVTGGGPDVATPSGSRSDWAGGWYRAQAGGMASGGASAGFETRIERARSTELK